MYFRLEDVAHAGAKEVRQAGPRHASAPKLFNFCRHPSLPHALSHRKTVPCTPNSKKEAQYISSAPQLPEVLFEQPNAVAIQKSFPYPEGGEDTIRVIRILHGERDGKHILEREEGV